MFGNLVSLRTRKLGAARTCSAKNGAYGCWCMYWRIGNGYRKSPRRMSSDFAMLSVTATHANSPAIHASVAILRSAGLSAKTWESSGRRVG
jgi:hypothetical protein